MRAAIFKKADHIPGRYFALTSAEKVSGLEGEDLAEMQCSQRNLPPVGNRKVTMGAGEQSQQILRKKQDALGAGRGFEPLTFRL